MNHPRPNLTSVVDDSNIEYFLGANPPIIENGKVLYNAPPLSSAQELIPRSKWVEFDSTLKTLPILDQNGFGACVGYAIAAAVMKSRLKAGMTFQRLSPCFVYALGNGNRDAGMVISTGADIIREKGIALYDEFPDGRIWRNQIPANAFETAKTRFLVDDVYSVSTFDEIGTALQLGWDVVWGITVGTQFSQLDADGCPGGGMSRGGHALCDGEGMKKGRRGNWLFKTRNSWRPTWGLNGFCYLSEDHFMRTGYIDAFAIRIVMTDPQETDKGRPLIMS